MKVPLLDLQAQNGPLRADILAAIARVADSQRFIMGPEIDALERELAAMLGIKHALAVSSGTDAVLLALMTIDYSSTDGDKVSFCLLPPTVTGAAASPTTTGIPGFTDTTVTHRAAIITLKLVGQSGGEARANTQWTVLTPGGDVIKEAGGAFPRVILAEGEYRVIARNDNKSYERSFRVVTGVDVEIEVLAR